MSDQKLYEIIEAYLNGDLNGKELSEFEARIKSDQKLADQIAIFKDVDYAIKDKPLVDFQKLVVDEGKSFLQEEDKTQTVVRKINWRRTLLIAASIVVFASALFVWKNQLNNPLTNEDLFAQHFESYELNESLRGTTNNVKDFDLAIQSYQNKDFNAAVETFKNLSNSSSADMVTKFCLANAYLNQSPKNFAAAKVEFEKVILEGNSIYVPNAKWYLALILLEQDKRSEAIKLLQEIQDTGGNLGAKSSQLIDQLKD